MDLLERDRQLMKILNVRGITSRAKMRQIKRDCRNLLIPRNPNRTQADFSHLLDNDDDEDEEDDGLHSLECLGQLMTATIAKSQFHLTEEDLQALPCITKQNPVHYMGYPMRLYDPKKIIQLSQAKKKAKEQAKAAKLQAKAAKLQAKEKLKQQKQQERERMKKEKDELKLKQKMEKEQAKQALKAEKDEKKRIAKEEKEQAKRMKLVETTTN